MINFRYLALAALVLAAHHLMISVRTTRLLRARTVALRMVPANLVARDFAPLRLAGAWRLEAADRRFGGVSSLALAGDQLMALSDAGSVLRFNRPDQGRAKVRIASIPSGPGRTGRKRGRDSEAMVADPARRGYWVAFEQFHSLFLFDPNFKRALARFDLDHAGWRDNGGVEAMVAHGRQLLLFPESGDEVVEWSAGGRRSVVLAGASPIADATRLPDGRVIVLMRRFTPLGFSNSLGVLERGRSGYRVTRIIPLPLGQLANGEAIAAEPQPGGAVRLWLMTDNDFRPALPTLLVAIDVPDGVLGGTKRRR